jgi:sulfur-carrier protein adenylyltransferase/sulfurtransferase
MTILGLLEQERYHRQTLLPELGIEGQLRLKAASVLVVGAGGLGCPTLLYLVSAGVGKITVIDADTVSLSNLHRQTLFNSNEINQSKVIAAQHRLAELNPHCILIAVNDTANSKNINDLVHDHDVVIDASDNFQTRYLLNDACRRHKVPLSYAAVAKFEGQSCFFRMGQDDPCLRCVYPQVPAEGATQNCSEMGVLGVVPGMFGLIQAKDTLLFLLMKSREETLPFVNKLFFWDILNSQPRIFNVQKSKMCPMCSNDTNAFFTQKDSKMNDKNLKAEVNELSVASFYEVWMKSKTAKTPSDPWVLLDVREQREVQICNIEGSHHVPLNLIETELQNLDRNSAIVVHCKSGGRSKTACEKLVTMGFKQVHNLAGGILGWRSMYEASLAHY